MVKIGAEKCSASYQKNVLKFIRAVFTYAMEVGRLKANPSPKLKFQMGDRVKKVLTESQVRILLREAHRADWEWYFHWAVALYTGLRSGELYALTWDKVNFEAGHITVDASWNNKDGFKSTKSGHERIVPISEALLAILKELKVRSAMSAFVLPRHEKWDKGEQARELRMFLKGIGLPEIRFHDLRATWATLLLSKNVPPAKVMKMGGWKDMKTMMIYLRMTGLDVVGATDSLNFHDNWNSYGQILDFKASSGNPS